MGRKRVVCTCRAPPYNIQLVLSADLLLLVHCRRRVAPLLLSEFVTVRLTHQKEKKYMGIEGWYTATFNNPYVLQNPVNISLQHTPSPDISLKRPDIISPKMKWRVFSWASSHTHSHRRPAAAGEYHKGVIRWKKWLQSERVEKLCGVYMLQHSAGS